MEFDIRRWRLDPAAPGRLAFGLQLLIGTSQVGASHSKSSAVRRVTQQASGSETADSGARKPVRQCESTSSVDRLCANSKLPDNSANCCAKSSQNS